jgi:Flp pilus assembly pilin Flp
LQSKQFGAVIDLEVEVRIQQCGRQFWYSDEGQDLIEYTLIIAAVAMGAFGILGILTPNVHVVWTASNSELSAAGSMAAAGAS